MNIPPPAKKRTIGYIISITGSSRTWRVVHLSRSFRTGSFRLRRCRPDLVVVELAHEDVAVHGLAAVVEAPRDRERIAGVRALPGDDHERLGRVVVAEDRHARHLLVALRGVVALLGGLFPRGHTG